MNEGVAFWFELRLSHRDRLDELGAAWSTVIGGGTRRPRELARDEGFWEAYRHGLPVYEVGACVVGYLVEANGLSLLKEIFRRSHGADQGLAPLIERQTGLAIEGIETRVGAWLPGAITRPADRDLP